jgi:prepilin-type N-terminal cleavage/methylation domain-containing protein
MNNVHQLEKLSMGRHLPSNGFSLIELLVVASILALLTMITLLGVARARTSFRFSNAVGTLKIDLEKAISDAKRRNAKGDERPTVTVLNSKSYQLKVDFDGDNVLETQTISLPDETSFLLTTASPPPKATVDWRGYVAEGTVKFTIQSDDGQASELTLTSRGDASTDDDFPVLPSVTVTSIATDVKSATVLLGNASPNPNISPTPKPTALPVCTNGQLPAVNDCRCNTGKVIDSAGKCK